MTAEYSLVPNNDSSLLPYLGQVDADLNDVAIDAIHNNNINLLWHLLDYGVDYNLSLSHAIREGTPDSVRLLLARGAIPDKNMIITALKQNKYPREVITLLFHHGISADAYVIGMCIYNPQINTDLQWLLRKLTLTEPELVGILRGAVIHYNRDMVVYLLDHYIISGAYLTMILGMRDVPADIAKLFVIRQVRIDAFCPSYSYTDFRDADIADMIRGGVRDFGRYASRAKPIQEFLTVAENEVRAWINDPVTIVMDYCI